MTTPNDTHTKSPTHSVYVVKKGEGEKSDWLKVGAAWEHGDKDGLNLSLTILGQTVPLTIRKNKPKVD